VRFFEAAKKYKLDEDCKCPSCGTSLIPVDHREQVESNGAATEE
jgi:rubredoxin